MTNKDTTASSILSTSSFDVIINGTKFAECFALRGNYMYCYFASAKKVNQSNQVNQLNMVNEPVEVIPTNLILKLHINIYAGNGYNSHILFYS